MNQRPINPFIYLFFKLTSHLTFDLVLSPPPECTNAAAIFGQSAPMWIPPPNKLGKIFLQPECVIHANDRTGTHNNKVCGFRARMPGVERGGGRGWCVQQLTKIQSSETLLIPRECNQLIKSWLKCQFSSTMLTILANGLRAFVQLWILSFVRAFVINNLLIRADIGENRTWPLIALNI